MRTDGTVVAGGVVSTDRALGLPTEEREDRYAVRARMEAKRARPTTSPFAGQSVAGAEAAYGTRSDVDPRAQERFTTPDLEPAPTAGFETFKRPTRRGGRQPREIPADVVETIRRLYGDGWSQARIADHLGGKDEGWTQRSVATAMERYSVERRPRGRGTERVRRGTPETPAPVIVPEVDTPVEPDPEPVAVVPPPLAVLETPAALAAVPAPDLTEHPDVRAFLAALQDALDTSAEVVLADVRNATDRLRARAVANRRTAAASRGRTA